MANISNFYAQAFTSNVELLLQQKVSKLAPMATMGNYKGSQAQVVEQIGAVEMQAVIGRFQPMGRVEPLNQQRWITPSDFDLPQLIDTFDKLRLLADPSSAYVANAVAAANRKKDQVFLNAFFGNSKVGIGGNDIISWDSQTAQIIAPDYGSGAGVYTGLTVSKLKKALEILGGNEVDFDSEEVYAAITQKQMTNLLNETTIISSDFNGEKPVLVDGRVIRFLGINFIKCEREPLDANGYRRIPVWVKSGMHMGMWNDAKTDVSERKDLQGIPWQAYLYMTLGATRLDEKRLVEIKCAETP